MAPVPRAITLGGGDSSGVPGSLMLSRVEATSQGGRLWRLGTLERSKVLVREGGDSSHATSAVNGADP